MEEGKFEHRDCEKIKNKLECTELSATLYFVLTILLAVTTSIFFGLWMVSRPLDETPTLKSVGQRDLVSLAAEMSPELMAAQKPVVKDEDLWHWNEWKVIGSWDDLSVLYLHRDWHEAGYLGASTYHLHLEKSAYELFKRMGRMRVHRLVFLRELQVKEKLKNDAKAAERAEY